MSWILDVTSPRRTSRERGCRNDCRWCSSGRVEGEALLRWCCIGTWWWWACPCNQTLDRRQGPSRDTCGGAAGGPRPWTWLGSGHSHSRNLHRGGRRQWQRGRPRICELPWDWRWKCGNGSMGRDHGGSSGRNQGKMVMILGWFGVVGCFFAVVHLPVVVVVVVVVPKMQMMMMMKWWWWDRHRWGEGSNGEWKRPRWNPLARRDAMV